MEQIRKVVDWLGAQSSFQWFDGNNITMIFLGVVLAFIITSLVSKKFRDKFF